MKKIVILFALLAWTLFIFHNSMEPAVVSSRRSTGALAIVNQFLTKFGMDFMTEHLLRKMGHFSEFAIEGVLLALFWGQVIPLQKGRIQTVALCGLLTAMTDETIQLFIEGRSCQVTDVWIDFCGVVVGLGLTEVVRWMRRKK